MNVECLYHFCVSGSMLEYPVQFNVGADAVAYLTVSTQGVFRH